MDDEQIMDCDLLVIGAGMAGLSAAGWAAERGARVIVVEKAAAIGGSAVLSGGVLWTASSPQRMALYGGGDAALGAVVCKTYPDAIAWLRRREIELSPKMNVLHGYGYQIDIVEHLRGCASMVEHAGGHVVLGTETVALVRDEAGAVVGARTEHPDGKVTVRARSTILATGGFQASPALRARYIHPNAEHILLRSQAVSDGQGLRLGEAAGGEVAGSNRGFYGHLVSESPAWGEERLYTMLTQYHSDQAILLNEQGRRFCDETQGDHTNTYHTVFQPGARALCFWDSRVHEQYATQPVVAIAPPEDKMEIALANGGKGVVAQTLNEVAAFAAEYGFDGAQVLRSIGEFNDGTRKGWERLDPPRSEVCEALDKPPFFALIVHAAITFTFGGLSIDSGARVLRRDGSVVPGLLAAGGDAGGAYGVGYAGGLALAMSFGITAARSAGWQ
jgi:succinate dehydrogenase/fumarate reductase flavoprotein subunit